MSDRFIRRWQKDDRPALKERMRDAVRSPVPLKPRLEAAVRGIQVQTQRLEQVQGRLTERDKTIFSKVVEAYSKHDMAHATIYANELVEIRKMARLITQARLALEQIVLRLSTVEELGDVVMTLAPAMGVIRNVRAGISGVLPEAERELSEVGNLLSGLLIDAGQTSGLNINFETANEDAQKILLEASALAEQKVKEKFPELPTELPTGEKAPTL